MNKHVFTGVAITALALMSASGAVMANNAAVVITDAACTAMDQYGQVTVAGTATSVANHGGNSTVKCYATGVANDSGKSIRFTGFDCDTTVGVTTRSWEVIDSEGNMTLTCQVK